MSSRWVSIKEHCSRYTVAPHHKRTEIQPKTRMGGRVTNWKDLSGSGWCPLWWGMVGNMIMNYQITLKAENEYPTISFSKRSAQLGQLVLKLKLSHYMPGQALPPPGVWGPRISRQQAHEGGKVVSPTHRPSLPPHPRIYPWYSFLFEAECTPEP